MLASTVFTSFGVLPLSIKIILQGGSADNRQRLEYEAYAIDSADGQFYNRDSRPCSSVDRAPVF